MISKCKFCGLDFSDKSPSQKGGHTRFCDLNPDKEKNLTEHRKRNKNQIPWNKGINSPYSDEINKKRAESVKKAHADGKYKDSAKKAARIRIENGNHLHTEDSKEKIRQGALASPHRRLKKNVIEYNGVLLDSSWELELAKRLDELGIEWIRPDPIPWTDKEGITHNYFPDFYLPEYNKYIDPKNPHAAEVQKEKLKVLLEQYDNIVILDTIEKCKNFVI